MSDDDDKKTVVMSNFSKGGTQGKSPTEELAMNSANETETMINTLHIKISMDMEISNAGEICHFLMPGTQSTNLKPSTKKLTINLPNGTQLQSTHTCEINVP